MNEDKQAVVTTGGGISFCGLLQIVFIVLKLCKVIDWPWVFVMMPLIVSGGLFVLIMLVVVIFALIAAGRN